MKDVPGYEGRYAVTRDGRVWSHPKMTLVGRNGGYRQDGDCWLTLRPNNRGRGYHRVALTDAEGNRRMLSVHRLVAMTYIDNPHNLPFVNHINGDTVDNRVENLEWCDAKGNAVHAYGKGWVSVPDQSGERNSQAKITTADVRRIRQLAQDGMGDTMIARKLNISRSTVKGITKGETWKDVA